MSITIDQAERKFEEAVEHFQKELSSIRAGRANPKLVEDIEVSVYGQKMPIKQIANITVADASLLIVQPWDKNNLDEIKKTLEFADIGINPLTDGDTLKLPIPSLTEERRLEYVKIMKQKAEETRITIRQIRKDVLAGIDAQRKEKELTEDEAANSEKQLQQLVDDVNDKIEKIAEDKEAELLTV